MRRWYVKKDKKLLFDRNKSANLIYIILKQVYISLLYYRVIRFTKYFILQK